MFEGNIRAVTPPPRRERFRDTDAVYTRGGRRHVRRVTGEYLVGIAPTAGNLIWALRQEVEDRIAAGEVLRPKTTRIYEYEYFSVISAFSPDLAIEISELWRRCRGTPKPKNTSSKMVTDVTDAELRELTRFSARQVVRYGSQMHFAALLYAALAPKIGNRPRELCGARVEGETLYLPNAKIGGTKTRSLKKWPDVWREGLGYLLAMVPSEPSAYESWYKKLAETLAYASSKSSRGRRICPYGLRHLAFATWKKAGLSAPLIAQLAGHLNLKSQQIYAGARYGSDFDARYIGEIDEPDAAPINERDLAARNQRDDAAALAAAPDNGDAETAGQSTLVRIGLPRLALAPEPIAGENRSAPAISITSVKPLPVLKPASRNPVPDEVTDPRAGTGREAQPQHRRPARSAAGQIASQDTAKAAVDTSLRPTSEPPEIGPLRSFRRIKLPEGANRSAPREVSVGANRDMARDPGKQFDAAQWLDNDLDALEKKHGVETKPKPSAPGVDFQAYAKKVERQNNETAAMVKEIVDARVTTKETSKPPARGAKKTKPSGPKGKP